jgi:glutamyl-tRNA synthetase
LSAEELVQLIKPYLPENIVATDAFLAQTIALVKERLSLLTDFTEQAGFFFQTPTAIDTDSIKAKWNENTNNFFIELKEAFTALPEWNHDAVEQVFAQVVTNRAMKKGEVMLPFRIMLVGGKFGPGVFDIAALIGKEETLKRISNALEML